MVNEDIKVTIETMLKMLGVSDSTRLCKSCGLYGSPITCPKCGRVVCSTCISVQQDMCMNCDEVIGLKINERV